MHGRGRQGGESERPGSGRLRPWRDAGSERGGAEDRQKGGGRRGLRGWGRGPTGTEVGPWGGACGVEAGPCSALAKSSLLRNLSCRASRLFFDPVSFCPHWSPHPLVSHPLCFPHQAVRGKLSIAKSFPHQGPLACPGQPTPRNAICSNAHSHPRQGHYYFKYFPAHFKGKN